MYVTTTIKIINDSSRHKLKYIQIESSTKAAGKEKDNNNYRRKKKSEKCQMSASLSIRSTNRNSTWQSTNLRHNNLHLSSLSKKQKNQSKSKKNLNN